MIINQKHISYYHDQWVGFLRTFCRKPGVFPICSFLCICFHKWTRFLEINPYQLSNKKFYKNWSFSNAETSPLIFKFENLKQDESVIVPHALHALGLTMSLSPNFQPKLPRNALVAFSFSWIHGTWPKRWSNLAPRSRDKRSPNYSNPRKNCLRSITGWGLTYPSEKYESVGMIIPPNMWNNQKYPNHQPDYYSYSPYDSNITQAASWSPWVRAEYNELMENSSDATWGSGKLGSATGWKIPQINGNLVGNCMNIEDSPAMLDGG